MVKINDSDDKKYSYCYLLLFGFCVFIGTITMIWYAGIYLESHGSKSVSAPLTFFEIEPMDCSVMNDICKNQSQGNETKYKLRLQYLVNTQNLSVCGKDLVHGCCDQCINESEKTACQRFSEQEQSECGPILLSQDDFNQINLTNKYVIGTWVNVWINDQNNQILLHNNDQNLNLNLTLDQDHRTLGLNLLYIAYPLMGLSLFLIVFSAAILCYHCDHGIDSFYR
jgi:hypothetical protein